MTNEEQQVWDEVYAKNLLMAANPTITEEVCKFGAEGADRAVKYRAKHLGFKQSQLDEIREKIKALMEQYENGDVYEGMGMALRCFPASTHEQQTKKEGE